MAKEYQKEMEKGYNALTVMEEAARCLLCLDAPCSKECPAGVDPGRFIRSVRFLNFKGAAETIREQNVLGGICARVCPTEKYCQKGCLRCGIDRPIDIGGIQRFVTDFEKQTKMEILKKGASIGKKIAVIGSGPSGIQATASLLILGYNVDIYEKNKEIGGYLRYGIPEYRLPNAIVDLEVDRIKKLGANIFCKKEVGEDVQMSELEEAYDAVLVVTGFSKAKMLPDFHNHPLSMDAITFLANVKSNGGNVKIPENVVVIGGGDVAMDVVTTLKMLGAKHVTDVVYEESHEFLASKKELEGARELGVTIIDGYVPKSVSENTVTFCHRKIESTLSIQTEAIILAVGQKPDVDAFGLKMNGNDVEADGYRIKNRNVFVAGDLTCGDKTVVSAVKKGKEAALAIDAFVGGKRS